MTTTDRLHPLGSLTPDEIEAARARHRSDPTALWPAIRAAVGVDRAEATLDRMDALLSEVRRCAT